MGNTWLRMAAFPPIRDLFAATGAELSRAHKHWPAKRTLDGEHRSLTMDIQEKAPCAVFNELLPMSSDKSVTHVPGLDRLPAP